MATDLLIDISRLLGRAAQSRLPTGVDRVCLAYVERWGSQARAVGQTARLRGIFSHAASQELFAILKDGPTKFTQRVNWAIAKSALPPWEPQSAAGKPSLYLGHSGVEAPGFVQWMARTRQRPVYFVHDLIPISHAEYCREGEQAAHVQRMTVMLQTGAGLICNSRFTLDSLTRFADSQGLPMPPAVVALLAPAALGIGSLHDADLRPFAKPYFVVLGTIEPRKNHLLLLNIWRELVLKLGSAAPHLIVIGQRGWECENVVDMLERCVPIKPFVHEMPNCSDADLARYLKHAQAMLFPSFVEGYGMPLIESLMLNTPVIASDLAVFKEVAGDVPDYLSAIDGLGWAQAVLDYSALDNPRRVAQVQRMQSFTVPTWDDHFAAVERLLAQLA